MRRSQYIYRDIGHCIDIGRMLLQYLVLFDFPRTWIGGSAIRMLSAAQVHIALTCLVVMRLNLNSLVSDDDLWMNASPFDSAEVPPPLPEASQRSAPADHVDDMSHDVDGLSRSFARAMR